MVSSSPTFTVAIGPVGEPVIVGIEPVGCCACTVLGDSNVNVIVTNPTISKRPVLENLQFHSSLHIQNRKADYNSIMEQRIYHGSFKNADLARALIAILTREFAGTTSWLWRFYCSSDCLITLRNFRGKNCA
jgi:hypothetical protein